MKSDQVLKELVTSRPRNDIRYQPYSIPEHTIVNGNTTVTIDGVKGDLKIFGKS